MKGGRFGGGRRESGKGKERKEKEQKQSFSVVTFFVHLTERVSENH